MMMKKKSHGREKHATEQYGTDVSRQRGDICTLKRPFRQQSAGVPASKRSTSKAISVLIIV